jgi:hypothetical protein
MIGLLTSGTTLTVKFFCQVDKDYDIDYYQLPILFHLTAS